MLHLPPLRTPIFALATALSLAASPARADVLLSDWKAPGDGLLLWDTTTNLQWLNLQQTAGMSYNQVVALLGTTYAGFSYATTNDVWTLFADAGLNPVYPAPAAAASSLSSLWGITMPEYHTAGGITGTDSSGLPGYKLGAGVGWGDASGTFWFGNATYAALPPDFQSNQFGSALVRPYQALAVPEPSTPVALLAGLAALSGLVRRHRQR